MLNENNEVVFNYQVNTIMPITGLSVGNLMVPSTAKLTKEDVLICLKKAPVFRRFNGSKLERVTASNLDRLHNEEYMTEAEYEEFLDKQGDNRGKVAKAPVEETKVVEEPVVEEVEAPVEEIKAEEPVSTEKIVEEAPVEAETEESAQTEEEVSDTVEEINDEGISEEVTEDDSPVVEDDTNNHKNNRYNNKKKHNR